MQHLEHFCDVIGMRHAGADMFCCTHNTRIGRVDVELARAWQFAAHIRALEEMNIVAMIDNARAIIKIDHCRLAVITRQRLNHIHCCTGGAVINILAPRIHVVTRVLRVKREATCGFRNCVFNKRARKFHPAIILVDIGAGLCHVFDGGGDRVSKTDLLQHIENLVMDLLHVVLRQHLIFAAGKTGPNRPIRIREFGSACLAARIAAPAAATVTNSRISCVDAHYVPPRDRFFLLKEQSLGGPKASRD